MVVKQNVSSSVAGSVESPKGRTQKPDKGAHFARLRGASCRVGFPSVEHLESEDRITAHPDLTTRQWEAAWWLTKKSSAAIPFEALPSDRGLPTGQAGNGKRNIA